MPFCDQCGKPISPDAVFCPSCGRKVETSAPQHPTPAQTAPSIGPVVTITESKNPGIAALLALILGLGFLYGIGHIYVGRIGRGIILLATGVILGILVYVSVFFGFLTYGAGFIVTIFLLLVALVVNIWQTYNAYRLAKEFNAHVQQYGKPPW